MSLQERLQRSEAELADKWAALHAASVGGTPNSRIIGRISMKSPNAVERVSSFRDQKVMTSHQGISPALRNLTKKSETKRVKK
ncbi:hypothetical protein OESDEN_19382 [Oesophagostomum dentatum]|uniref:Uncharacterized protein n=1 Tax=Oesophagostomum dentatum TaxID=61180 RepID=A0A0B1SBK3_OESDE|nr:hypothetical protein OESDEN_19382 [Oesophagostomum dentatum]